MKTENTKRVYTKRGTTVAGKRVVLIDGVPVGRGRPAKEGKGNRTVVFIPFNETYDVAKHGIGVRFNHASHGVLKRLKVNSGNGDAVDTTSLNPVAENVSADVVEVNIPAIVPIIEAESIGETVTAAESPVGETDKW